MKVTVLLITYNHERFIRQALDSALAQVTDFDFEILISEDCSTDRTREIVNQYAETYPHKIRLLLSSTNLHSTFVVERGLSAARGEYVAFLDGDDYWTSPHKLQKQVGFMDANPECVLSWHPVEHVDVDGNRLLTQPVTVPPSVRTIEDFLAYPATPDTASVMMRNSLPEIPAWYLGCPVGDTPLWAIALQYGQGGCLNETMAAYRIHANGFMSGRTELAEFEIGRSTYEWIFHHIGPTHRKVMTKPLATWCVNVAIRQRWAGEGAASRQTAREGLKDCPRDPRLYFLAYAPWAWVPARILFRLARRCLGQSPKGAGN